MKRPLLIPTLAITSGLALISGSAVWAADSFTTRQPVAGASATTATATTTVSRADLVSQVVLDATLGYAGTYTIGYPVGNRSTGNAHRSSSGGTMRPDVTALARVGQVITEGQTLFAVNGTPTVLLYGSTPPWRTLTEGTTGPDVAELNADLVALGDATAAQLDSASDTYSAVTATAVKKLQANLNTTQTGTLALGQAVFEPTPIRVTSVSADLGGPAPAGGPILAATSTTRLVTATIDASQRSELHPGDAVTITLADGTTTTGNVTSIGADATEPSDDGPPGSAPPPPTVAVTVTPTDPSATGTVDQTPVIVAVTIAAVRDALAVPAAALVTTSAGRSAINILEGAGRVHALPVTLGIFDDANGLVQISGPSIRAGETIALAEQLTTGP
jgi:hypothetical protein